MKNLVPGRRRGAQLRRQRPHSARRAVREHLDSAGRGRRRRRAGRGAVHLAPAARTSRGTAEPSTASKARCSGPRFDDAADPRVSRRRRAPTIALCDDDERAVRHGGRADWPTKRSSAGCRAGWSSARGRSAAAASWATPAASEMQSVMNLKIKFRESFRPFAPIGAARTGVASISRLRPGEDSPYMLLVAPVRAVAAHSPTAARRELRGLDKLQAVPLDDSGRHARRLLGPGADGRRRAARPLLHGCSSGSRRRPAARVRDQHQLQRARRADRLHAGRRLPLLSSTHMDVLVLERFVLVKKQTAPVDNEAYLSQFSLD